MISQSKTRVQAIKSRFENLNVETEPLAGKKLCIAPNFNKTLPVSDTDKVGNNNQENENDIVAANGVLHEEKCPIDDSPDLCVKPNSSYLYGKNDLKRCASDTKKSLTRQSSDPGKKLHRSHAFRCDRSQKIIGQSPKRHGSCNGRSETSDFTLKMGERKLTKERLKLLGDFIEDQMRKDSFTPQVPTVLVGEVRNVDSIPDSQVPKHILDQYAKVVKGNKTEKQDAMTDSGVSSETENIEEEKSSKIKQLVSQYEKCDKLSKSPLIPDKVSSESKPPLDKISLEKNKPLISDKITEQKPQLNETASSVIKYPVIQDKRVSLLKENKSNTLSKDKADSCNLESMNDLCASSETMKLEKKNPHLTLTDTLKKALKQPLPPGPPPKKPPRTFVAPIPESPDKQRKDPRKMLEKLEQVLEQREAEKAKNIYDIAEDNVSKKKPKEMHYLCTEILDIAQRTLPNQNVLDPFSKCLNSLNCAIVTNNSMTSLPYTRLGSENRNSPLCSCSNDSLNKRLSTFSNNQEKCFKCQSNDKSDGFICHLHCKCKTMKSEFYLKEHIYDVPCVEDSGNNDRSKYGTLKSLQHSKSMENLSGYKAGDEEEKIYDEPTYDVPSRSPTPKSIGSKSDFQKLRENFENPHKDTSKHQKSDIDKGTPLKTLNTEDKVIDRSVSPKPVLSNLKVWKSSENVSEGFREARKNVEKKFSTDGRRYRKAEKEIRKTTLSLPNKEQLDCDKENLNRLMTEIYETVAAACIMDENRPSSFPTEQSDGNTSEESVKLTRSLTEKRVNYVRRVSSRVAYLEPRNVKSLRFRHQTSICSYKSEVIETNPYSTFRSWKSFRTSQNNLTKDKMDRRDSTDSKFNLTDSRGNILSMKDDLAASDNSIDDLSIDEKTGCVDIELPFEPRERGLFNICLLVGLNYMTGEAYVKSVFPSQVQVPPHIENLIFPETLSSTSKGEWCADAKGAQCYSLVLTDERGERSYGYCRRVLPEGATTCLPLCYCLIGKYRAPGFYYKVLQELESHHGDSEIEINHILEQLFDMDFPNPGEQITITYTVRPDHHKPTRPKLDLNKSKTLPDSRRLESRLEVSVSVKKEQVTETAGSSDRLEGAELDIEEHELPEFYDLENNNSPKNFVVNVEKPRTHIIKRPLEPRVDENNFSVLLDTLGAGLVIKVFGSLLLERKVIIMGDELSTVSSCLEALQCSLYPLVWQQPLISSIPSQIQRDVLQAPLPILAGMRADRAKAPPAADEGMLIDVTAASKVLFYQGDESTILPTTSYKTLKTSLQMESIKNKDREDTKTRNVMISEAFLRFFVDILGDFWKHFSFGELKEGDMGKNGVVFDKEAFVKNAPSKQNQYFLEWFTETAMFNHFIQNMAVHHSHTDELTLDSELVDCPLPNFYELFLERSRSRPKAAQKWEARTNYKNAMHRKVKMLKSKLRDLVG